MASIAEKKVTLLREPGAIRDVLPLSFGAPVLWDGRWLVTTDTVSPAATIRALGSPPHERLDALAPGLRHRIPQGRIRAGLPAIWEGECLTAIPSFDNKAPLRMVYAKQTFF
jgi:hypothetical protein